ncbi:MAG: hypothetical protein EOP42_21375 [Sphingobacteriaceae bacterium]|nr:MAG: hypothetical protein EOP42_21375 [Sphingobacteriaceae bacterium]
MNFKKTCIVLLLIVFLLLINAVKLQAQGVPTACGGDPDIECPVDGPVIFLLIAILLLSVKKIAGKNQAQLQIKEG